MAAPLLDAPLLDRTDPARRRRLPAPILEARQIVRATVDDILAIPEASLPHPWSWIGGSEEEVRYGAYRVHELYERAEIEARRSLAGRGYDGGLAADLIAPSGAARWDLHGVLAPLSASDLDADPGGGEWSIRRTLGHVISGQRAYGWVTAWWQERGCAIDDPDLPAAAPEEVYAGLPDEDGPEMAGSLDDLRDRLDAILDLSAACLAGLSEDRLAHATRWSGFAVTVGFRIGRWSIHLREHTIQVEKTLARLGRTPTEPERLARLAFAAYGRAEAVVFGQPGADAAAGIIRAAAVEARQTIADARAAAEV
ncbi:MAG: DinB family protein [Chloroflexi bacterium]|nr:DinB family protein [Chloroflexota bacterium]